MKKIKKLSFIGLCLIIISILTVEISAATDWEIEYDGYIITDGIQSYQLYWEDDAQCRIDPRSAIYYTDTVKHNGEHRIVYTSPYATGILWIDNGGKNLIFATSEGVENVERFLESQNHIYYLEDTKGNYAKIPGSVMAILELYLDEADTVKKISASELKDMLRFDVTLHDETETLAGDYGALFELNDGQYYFLRFADCDKKAFNGKGYFAYNQTEVTLIRLNDDVSMDFINVMSQIAEKTTEEIHEDEYLAIEDEEYQYEYVGAFAVFFWIFYLIIGIVIPAAGMVIGIILPLSESKGRPKYWYALAISCGIWLVTAVTLAITLII